MEMSPEAVDQIIEQLLPHIRSERWERIEEVVAKRTLKVIPVLENIYDRGNTSAVMRSAEAFGYSEFHIIENPETRFKTANRVTRGTDKWLDIYKFHSTKECVAGLKQRGFKIYATHLKATTSIDALDFSQAVAVVLGNEKNGISEEMAASCDGTFKVPMYGFAQSFNISVAAALCFYRIHQMREQQLGPQGDLDEHGKRSLLAWYLFKTIGQADKILTRKGL